MREAGMAEMSAKFREMGGKVYVDAENVTPAASPAPERPTARVQSGDREAVKNSNKRWVIAGAC